MLRNEMILLARKLLDQAERGDVPSPAPTELETLADRLEAFRLRALPFALRRQAVRLRTCGPNLPFAPPTDTATTAVAEREMTATTPDMH